MATASEAPLSSGNVATRRGKDFLPLSGHGMPKTPYTPEGGVRPHRFSAIGTPPQFASPPMSPPMSAKSFGTFIDSAPSTPAYSPRTGDGWESSTLMLLSPVSTAPSSPPEPKWEMMTPVPTPTPRTTATNTTTFYSRNRGMSNATSHSAQHVRPAREDQSQKENTPPREGDEQVDGEAEKKREESALHVAPLGKLATRMKSMLRRKSSGDKKTGTDRRRRKYQELDYMEDVHWTEM